MSSVIRGLAMVFLAFLVLATLASTATIGVHAIPTQGKQVVYQEHYKKTEVKYTSLTSPVGTQLLYTVVQAQSSGVARNQSVAMNATTYASTVIGAPRSVVLNVSSNYDEASMGLSVTLQGSGATLLLVGLREDSVTQIVWAGVEQLSGEDKFTGEAYVSDAVNSSLVLGFASEGGVQYLAAPLNQSLSTTLSLPSIPFTLRSQVQLESNLVVALPLRYEAYTEESTWVNASATISSHPAKITVESFLGAEYPAIIWRGNTTTQFSGNSSPGFSVNISRNVYTFYGVNGTLVGYVDTAGLSGTRSFTLAQLNVSTQVEGSSILVVYLENQSSYTLRGETHSYTVIVGGEPVIVTLNSSLSAASTATVQTSHKVYVNATALLLYLNTSKSTLYLLVNPHSNTSAVVTEATPQNVHTTTITVGSNTQTS
ncbi:MAG: hypothetical protein QXP58_07650 [Thermoprotei archaeon]